MTVRFCQCEKNECQYLQKGEWTAEFSPYRNIFIDARFEGDELGTVTVSLEEGLQGWHLVCLLMVCILHFYAPLVSIWALFYCTSLMALGVLLLVIFSLHQMMKLISMGNKSFLYILLIGSLASVATFSGHFFTRLAKSILVNFGIRTEIHISVLPSHVCLAVKLLKTSVISVESSEIDLSDFQGPEDGVGNRVRSQGDDQPTADAGPPPENEGEDDEPASTESRHPNIIRFKEVGLAPTHLVIVMEFTAAGCCLSCLSGSVTPGGSARIYIVFYTVQNMVYGEELAREEYSGV